MRVIKEYVKVKSLEEAYVLNQKRLNRIAGGNLWLRLGKNPIGTLIDLSDVVSDKIEEDEENFYIGAMTTLSDLENDDSLNYYTHSAVKKAVENIVGVQFRNMATVGGSLWSRFGFSDVLTVFLALESQVELYKGGVMSLEEFASRKMDNDILLRLIVKKTPLKVIYEDVRLQSTDFPLLTLALSKKDEKYKVVVGARPGKAKVIVKEAEKDTLIEETMKKVRVSGNYKASEKYRRHLVEVLLENALEKMEK